MSTLINKPEIEETMVINVINPSIFNPKDLKSLFYLLFSDKHFII